MLTVHDPLSPLPIELGAEFVHGRPPETWEWIRAANLTAYEHSAEALHLDGGRVLQERQVGEIADRLLSRAASSTTRKDRSFEDYMRRSRQRADFKDWARVHIEGFNAARAELIGVASLTQDAAAAQKIEGDRAFRILNGYDSIPVAILRSIPDHQSVVHLNSVVERVNWRRGSVEVHYRSAVDDHRATLRCRQLIITVPLGVLQAPVPCRGAIQFDPEPTAILNAAKSLRFGQVYRITFRFRSAFWAEDEKLKCAGFLISRDKRFFTWWTTHPVISPLLTAWMAGSAADRFPPSEHSHVAAEALASLARILNRKIPEPKASYFHDWHSDPFFRGAYSYAPVNTLAHREALATPVDGTLFFAGEATELKGHSATVHGAIASGARAAELLVRNRTAV
jgi:monoamine oxidase